MFGKRQIYNYISLRDILIFLRFRRASGLIVDALLLQFNGMKYYISPRTVEGHPRKFHSVQYAVSKA